MSSSPVVGRTCGSPSRTSTCSRDGQPRGLRNLRGALRRASAWLDANLDDSRDGISRTRTTTTSPAARLTTTSASSARRGSPHTTYGAPRTVGHGRNSVRRNRRTATLPSSRMSATALQAIQPNPMATSRGTSRRRARRGQRERFLVAEPGHVEEPEYGRRSGGTCFGDSGGPFSVTRSTRSLRSFPTASAEPVTAPTTHGVLTPRTATTSSCRSSAPRVSRDPGVSGRLRGVANPGIDDARDDFGSPH